jgi:oxygen-dependent protoporphyrinogen oxidase
MLASLAAGKARKAGGGSPFVTMARGIGQLADALADALGRLSCVDVRTGSAIASLERSGGGVTARLAGGGLLRPEAILLATPARVTARLVEPFAPAAAAHLDAIPYGSTGVITLAYREEQFPGPVTSHGFLVADDEPLSISAATISSRKWAGRAPEGTVLVRLFVGDRRDTLLRSTDEEIVAACRRDLESTLGARGEPLLVRVSRWVDQMPKYTVGHVGRVNAAFRDLASVPGVVLAGSAFRGVGLPDCVAQGRSAAQSIIEAANLPPTGAGHGPGGDGSSRAGGEPNLAPDA